MASCRRELLVLVLLAGCSVGSTRNVGAQTPSSTDPPDQSTQGSAAALLDFLAATKVAVNIDGYYA